MLIPAILTLTGALVLVFVAMATARKPTDMVGDLETFLIRWSSVHGGYDPRSNRFVRAWLRLSYRLSSPLARRGVQPNVLTLWGVWLAVAVVPIAGAGNRWPLVAAAVLLLSAGTDSLDGTVAVLTGRASHWGALLDGLADRVSEAAYLFAVWLVGAAGGLVVVAGVVSWLHEYVRARSAAAGFGGIGLVTPAERPTRVICCAGALASAGALRAHAAFLADLWLILLIVLTTAGFVQLLIAVHRALR
jgi:phosphatidylglycerophosphate synthase